MKETNPCLDNNCSSCCHDVRIRLTDKEYEFLISAGTDLERDTRFVSYGMYSSGAFAEHPDGKKTYIMNGACGLLVQGLCSVYKDAGRPEICAETMPGEDGCKSARKQDKLAPITLYDSARGRPKLRTK
ncbi:YkgJ family cysteine cluster protein [Candidatus Roizmanbacteria bacterium]|nr:YkgJ family cysteine cluster protein [Candidatus Roizmanbacteria bacterium]